MADPAAACVRDRSGSSRSRTQGEANTGGIGEPEDDDPALITAGIRTRGVVESIT
jgi:hypothetical protein